MAFLRRHWPLFLIVLLAAALRIYKLDYASLWIDESFSLQSSAGRGWFVDLIPRNTILDPAPRPISIDVPPPPGGIVGIYKTQLTDTNPPLYYMLLRGWRELTPQTDFFYRLPGVFFGSLTVAAMYAALTAAFGRKYGILAALITALSCLQIQFSQEVRPYVMACSCVAVCMAFLFRIEVHGYTLRRGAIMALFAVMAICSLYLSAVPLFAIGVYSLTTLQGRTRDRVLLTGLAAILASLLLVGPLLYNQWPWLSSRNKWLLSDDPRTIAAVTEDVVQTIYGQLAPITSTSRIPAYVSCIIILAFFIPLWRHVPRSRLFIFWSVFSIGILAYWDYFGGKVHLQIPRYALAAGPGVFGLIVSLAVLARSPKFKLLEAIPYAAILLTLISLSVAWPNIKEPTRQIVNYCRAGNLKPSDLVLVATNSDRDWENVLYLTLDQYVPTPFAAVMVTPQKPVGDMTFIREEAIRRGGLVIFMEVNAPIGPAVPPGWQRTALLNYPSIGYLSTFRPPAQSSTQSTTQPTLQPTTAPTE